MAGISAEDGGLRIGATTTVADLARDPRVADYSALATAAAAVASPQLREMGTVAGNLCQQPRCWYFRHPDLRCWLQKYEADRDLAALADPTDRLAILQEDSTRRALLRTATFRIAS